MYPNTVSINDLYCPIDVAQLLGCKLIRYQTIDSRGYAMLNLMYLVAPQL